MMNPSSEASTFTTTTFTYSVNRFHLNKRVNKKKYHSFGFEATTGTAEELRNEIAHGFAIAPGDFGRQSRKKSNFRGADLIGLDFDGGFTIADARENEFLKKHALFIYTTVSHQKPKHGEPPWDRFRVILPLSQKLRTAEEYEAVVAHLLEKFPQADSACSDCSRYFAGHTDAQFWELGGEPLSLEFMKDAARAYLAKQQKIEQAKQEREKLREIGSLGQSESDLQSAALDALNYIPPRRPGTGTYGESLRVLMALASIFPEEQAIAIAEAWSPPQDGWNPAEKIRAGFRGEVTAGSLFYIAKQHGWQPPQRAGLGFSLVGEIKKALKQRKRDSKGFAPNAPQPAPEPEVIIYEQGKRLKTWQQQIAIGSKIILDASRTGYGKSHEAGMFASENGAVWYLDANHRNPSTLTVEENFTDVNSRHTGLEVDPSRKTALGNPFIVHNSGQENPTRVPGNCHQAGLFNTLKQKGYTEADAKPICGKCPFIAACGKSTGKGYGFKFERGEAFKSNRRRAHPASLPDPDEYDYSNDTLIVEEASQSLSLTASVTGDWGDILAQFDRLEAKLEAKDETAYNNNLKGLKTKLRQLFEGQVKGDRYGVNHEKILEQIDQVDIAPETTEAASQLIDIDHLIDEPDSIRGATGRYREAGEYVRSVMRNQAREANKQALANLPANLLPYLLKILSGELSGSLHYQNGQLTINYFDTRLAKIVAAAKAVILLDATPNLRRLAGALGVKSDEITVVEQDSQPLSNLNVIGIETEGMKSNSHSDDCKNRLAALKRELEQKHPNIQFLGIKAETEKLDLDGYWFRDNRGQNGWQGQEAIAALGLPYIHVGQAQAEYRCLKGGSLDGFDVYYQTLVEQEIIQAIGRFRAHLHPEKQFTFYLVGTALNLSFLKPLGVTIEMKHAGEITPEAAKGKSRARFRAFQLAGELLRTGQKLTQQALAQGLKVTQGWLSQLFDESLTWQRFKELLDSLYSSSFRESNNFADPSSEQFREWLGLNPLGTVRECVNYIKSLGWQEFRVMFEQLATDVQWRLLGAMAACIPKAREDLEPGWEVAS